MTTPNLPFQLHAQLPQDPYSGWVRVRIVPDEEELEQLEALKLQDEPPSHSGASSLVALIEQSVNAQFFTVDGQAPAQWHTQSASVGSAFDWELRAQVQDLPLHVWAHLLALLRKNHDALEPMVRLEFEAHGCGQTQPLEALLAAVPQDLDKRATEFEYDQGGIDASRNLSIELSFVEPVSSQTRARVENDMGLWLQLNLLGAFELGLEEAEDLDPLGRVSMLSDYRMRCTVPYVHSDVSGFVALDNWVRVIHRHVQALEEVIWD